MCDPIFLTNSSAGHQNLRDKKLAPWCQFFWPGFQFCLRANIGAIIVTDKNLVPWFQFFFNLVPFFFFQLGLGIVPVFYQTLSPTTETINNFCIKFELVFSNLVKSFVNIIILTYVIIRYRYPLAALSKRPFYTVFCKKYEKDHFILYFGKY